MFRPFTSGSDYTNWGFTEIGEIWEEDGCPIEWHIKDFFSYTATDSSFCSRLFHVSGLPWHLCIIPHGDTEFNYVGWIGLYLFRDDDSATPQGVTFSFGVKRADGTVENLVNFTDVINEKGHGIGCPNFLQRSVLIRRSAELAPSDTLTLTCCLSVMEITDPYASINVSKKFEIGAISVKSDRFVEWTIKDIFSYDTAENFCYHSPHFAVSDSLWCMRIYPNGQTEKKSTGWIGLYLFKLGLSPPSLRANLNLGVKTADGMVQEFIKDLTWVFGEKGSEFGFGEEKFLQRSEMLSRRAVLVLEDTLTLTLSIETSSNTEIGVISVAGDGSIEWTILDIFSYEKEDDSYHSPSFDVSGSPWYFSICPNGTTRCNNVGWIELFLHREDYSAPPQRANITMGVKKANGTVEQIRNGCNFLFDEKGSAYGNDKLLQRSELLSRKEELAPKGALTLTLSIKTSSKLEIGEISVKDDRRIEWKIKDIFSYEEDDDFYYSPRFDVSGLQWYLSIYPNGEKKYNSVGWIQLHLNRVDNSAPSQRAKCIFGVRRIDGTVEQMRTVTAVFGEKIRRYGDDKLLQRSELLCRKTELAPEDTLTLTLSIKTSGEVNIGEISVKDDRRIEWNIKDIFSYEDEDDFYDSPRFDVSGLQWYLSIYPNSQKYKNVNWIHLFLYKEDDSAPPQRVNFAMGVKKADGTVEQIRNGFVCVFDEKGSGYGDNKLLLRSELLRRKAELAPKDALTLTLSIKTTSKLEIGEISVKDDRRIEWNIKDIFSYEEEDDFYDSPRFDVSGSRWYLTIYPNGEKKYNSVGWIQLYLNREDDSAPSQRAKCIFGVRRTDGTVEQMRTFTVVFVEKGRRYGDNKLLQRLELLCRKTELAPEDTLTLTMSLTLSNIIEIGAISVEGDGHIEWRIEDIFSYEKESDLFFSPRFDVSHTRWYLGIYPNGHKNYDSVGWITLLLYREDVSAPPQRTKFSFGVKKAYGNVKHLVEDYTLVFDEKEEGFGFRLLQRSVLRRRRAKLTSGDALVLTCSLKVYDNLDSSASECDCDCCNLS